MTNENINKLDRIRSQMEKKYGEGGVKVEFGDAPIFPRSINLNIMEPIFEEIDTFELGEYIKMTFKTIRECKNARVLFYDFSRRKQYIKTIKLRQLKEDLYIIKVSKAR